MLLSIFPFVFRETKNFYGQVTQWAQKALPMVVLFSIFSLICIFYSDTNILAQTLQSNPSELPAVLGSSMVSNQPAIFLTACMLLAFMTLNMLMHITYDAVVLNGPNPEKSILPITPFIKGLLKVMGAIILLSIAAGSAAGSTALAIQFLGYDNNAGLILYAIVAGLIVFYAFSILIRWSFATIFIVSGSTTPLKDSAAVFKGRFFSLFWGLMMISIIVSIHVLIINQVCALILKGLFFLPVMAQLFVWAILKSANYSIFNSIYQIHLTVRYYKALENGMK
ncbi:MAG: hypothetical protein FJ161_04120 [Gammaproteobacteria bacterium]|nr:hypothetical protein [Gammaproteobacteria bacterium]